MVNNGEVSGIVQGLVEMSGIAENIAEMRGEVQKTDGSIYVAVISKTKAEWAENPQVKSVKNVLYVYSDYREIIDPETGEITGYIPRIKIGDGVTHVVDLPFSTMSITQDDIEKWDNKSDLKVTVDEELHRLVFY